MADPDAAAARADSRVTHTAEEHQTQLAMVAAGLGIAVMPRLGRGSIDGVSIVSLKPAFPARSTPSGGLWRPSDPRSRSPFRQSVTSLRTCQRHSSEAG